METPFYGVPRLTAELKRRGYKVNHKRVRRLQKSLNLRTVYPRPRFNTSEPYPEHEKFPYLLSKCKIERPNQVWSTDITYTAVAGHRAFVIGIVDWFSRKVLAYNVVNTMDAFHCVETLKMAVDSYGKPEIHCVETLKMAVDSYGKPESFNSDQKYVSLPQLRFRVQHYVNFYNSRRIHSVLQYRTPDEVYFRTCNRQTMAYSKPRGFTPIF